MLLQAKQEPSRVAVVASKQNQKKAAPLTLSNKLMVPIMSVRPEEITFN